MNRLVALAPLGALTVGVALFAGWSLRRDPHVTPMATVGQPMPALTLSDLDDGARTRLASVVKGPALVNFYASWCAPCAQESSSLMALKYEGVRIIGIAYKDAPDASHGFLSRLGDPYAARLSDPDGSAGIEFGVTGVPETYAVDAHGVIRGKVAMPLDTDTAEKLLAAATQ
ncbi:MAG TPA: DsbE family thiol:disulfide interchange protein [Caulobacteraceae bacterium]|jgi:cytochrome c biogenesis protein CcmG/thiol:disulfide interchange protein DsbE